MRLKGLLLALYFTCTACLADQVIKEETNPPAAEGPITADQLQPLFTQPVLAVPTDTTNPASAPVAGTTSIETAPTDTISPAAHPPATQEVKPQTQQQQPAPTPPPLTPGMTTGTATPPQ